MGMTIATHRFLVNIKERLLFCGEKVLFGKSLWGWKAKLWQRSVQQKIVAKITLGFRRDLAVVPMRRRREETRH